MTWEQGSPEAGRETFWRQLVKRFSVEIAHVSPPQIGARSGPNASSWYLHTTRDAGAPCSKGETTLGL